MRAVAALAVLLVLAPGAEAAIAVGNVRVPERTAADHPFPVSLRLHNDGDARAVTLLAALYAYEEGKEPCGAQTDPRFRTFTHVAQERVHLPARGSVDFPSSGRLWLQRYGPEDAPSTPATMELCVFVADADAPGPQIEYEAYASVPLWARARNAPPTGEFTWTPTNPEETDDVVFVGEGRDPDGDPVSFRWDFGHANATGRAVAEGQRVVHFFYPEGDYVVTMVVTDGMDETSVEKGIRVIHAPAPGETSAIEVEPQETPLAWWLPLAALALLAWRRRH